MFPYINNKIDLCSWKSKLCKASQIYAYCYKESVRSMQSQSHLCKSKINLCSKMRKHVSEKSNLCRVEKTQAFESSSDQARFMQIEKTELHYSILWWHRSYEFSHLTATSTAFFYLRLKCAPAFFYLLNTNAAFFYLRLR